MSAEPETNASSIDDTSDRAPIGKKWFGYNAALWTLVVALLLVVNAIGVLRQLVEQSTAATVAEVVLFASIPLLAMLITRLIVPRRKSRVEDFRPSPFDEDGALARPASDKPISFSKRLAGYLHVPEEEVLVPREPAASAMPFWCSVELPRRSTIAKSIAYIRAILERIRAAVRGS